MNTTEAHTRATKSRFVLKGDTAYDFETWSGSSVNVLIRHDGKADFRRFDMREGESFEQAIQRFLGGRR